MRILLAAKHPPGGELRFGGVQSWISTVAAEFHSRGALVEIWGPELAWPSGSFDIAVCAHFAAIGAGQAISSVGRILWISHGVVQDEAPPRDGTVAFTSEEVRGHWRRAGEILRQPIDLEFWKPAADHRDALVFYSYRSESDLGLSNLARRIGLKFSWLRDVDQEQARAQMRRAAIVCASGRAALEAMASGAPVLIFDHRPYNGRRMAEPDLERARASNYSGRSGFDPDETQLISMVTGAMKRGSLTNYAREHHDVRNIVDRIIELCS